MEEKKKVNKRSFSRFFATQILFSYFSDISENKDINDLKSFMEEYYIGDEFSQDNPEEYKKDVNIDFLGELLNGVLNNLEKIVCAIDDYQRIMFIYVTDLDKHFFFDCE